MSVQSMKLIEFFFGLFSLFLIFSYFVPFFFFSFFSSEFFLNFKLKIKQKGEMVKGF